MDFIIPVQFIGTKHYRVTADSLEEAVKEVSDKADITAAYDLGLTGVTKYIGAPWLMLDESQKETWLYWAYGYHGTDGDDWCVHYTNKGQASIPDFAEERYPVPADWIDSWKDNGSV